MNTHEKPMTVEEAKRLIEAQNTLTIDEAKKIVAKEKENKIGAVIMVIILFILFAMWFNSNIKNNKPVVIKNHGGYAGDHVYR